MTENPHIPRNIGLKRTNEMLDEILLYLRKGETSLEIDKDFWKLFSVQSIEPAMRESMNKLKQYYNITDRNVIKPINNLEKPSVIDFRGLFNSVKDLLKVENTYNYKFVNGTEFNTTQLRETTGKIEDEIITYNTIYEKIIEMYNELKDSVKYDFNSLQKTKVHEKCDPNEKLLLGSFSSINKNKKEIDINIKTIREYERIYALIGNKEKIHTDKKNAESDVRKVLSVITGKDMMGKEIMLADVEKKVDDMIIYAKVMDELNNKEYDGLFSMSAEELGIIVELIQSGANLCIKSHTHWTRFVTKHALKDDMDHSKYANLIKVPPPVVDRNPKKVWEIVKSMQSSIVDMVEEDDFDVKIKTLMKEYNEFYIKKNPKYPDNRDVQRMKKFTNETIRMKTLPKTYIFMLSVIKCICSDEMNDVMKAGALWQQESMQKFLQSYLIHNLNLVNFVKNYDRIKTLTFTKIEPEQIKELQESSRLLHAVNKLIGLFKFDFQGEKRKLIEKNIILQQEIDAYETKNKKIDIVLRQKILEIDQKMNILQKNIDIVRELFSESTQMGQYADSVKNYKYTGGNWDTMIKKIEENKDNDNDTTRILFAFNHSVSELKSLMNNIYNKLATLDRLMINIILFSHYAIHTLDDVIKNKITVDRFVKISTIRGWSEQFNKKDPKPQQLMYEILIGMMNIFIRKMLEITKDLDGDSCIDLEQFEEERIDIILVMSFLNKSLNA